LTGTLSLTIIGTILKAELNTGLKVKENALGLMLANIILIIFIFLMSKAIFIENDIVLRESENASLHEIAFSSLFVIGGFYWVHFLMYGADVSSSLGSRGIILVVSYEIIGMMIFLLFRKQFLDFLHSVNKKIPLILKIPVGFELFICCYLLATNLMVK